MNFKFAKFPQIIRTKMLEVQNLKAVIFNTGWLLADRILRLGVGLFVSVWVARYLGATQYGILSFAGAFVSLFTPIRELGLPLIVVRTLISKPERRNQVLGTTLILSLISSLIIFSLAIGLIAIWKTDDYLTLALVSILASAGIFKSFDTVDLWFQSQVKSKYPVIAKNTAFIIASVSKVGLIVYHAPLLAFAGAQLAEIFLGSLGLILVYQMTGQSILQWRWQTSLAKKLLQESWPLIFGMLSVSLYMKADQLMLGEMSGFEAVGSYAAATRISEAWIFIPASLASSVTPSIYEAKKQAESTYYSRLEKLLRATIAISVIISIPLTLFSGKIIESLYGSEFASAGYILAIHIWGSLFHFMGIATSPWFIAEGLTGIASRRPLLGAIVNIILNLALIPVYGGIGAAIATVIAQAFACFLGNALIPETRYLFKLQLRSLNPLTYFFN